MMDPNASLDSLRADIQTALGAVYSAEAQLEYDALEDLLRDIAETFNNLDDWLTKGGVAPNAWLHP